MWVLIIGYLIGVFVTQLILCACNPGEPLDENAAVASWLWPLFWAFAFCCGVNDFIQHSAFWIIQKWNKRKRGDKE